MATKRRSARRPEDVIAATWRGWWHTTEGRAAIGALFAEFGIYSAPPKNADLARDAGQRDVLCRIAEMIRLQDQEFPAEAEDTDALLERQASSVMRQYNL